MHAPALSLLVASLFLVSVTPDTEAVGSSFFSEDVRYESGDLVLAGELMLPGTESRQPAVVILQGSGDSDRSNLWAAAIAREFVDNGLVVLLTDKRGCGKSEGDWRIAGFEELAADALASVRYLRDRPEVDPKAVGLAGLSQGGWVAPIAAAHSSDVAFVVDISGCTVSFAEQTLLEMTNTASQAGLGEEGVRGVVAMQRAISRYLADGDWAAYAAERQRGLDASWKPIAVGYPDDPDLPIWTFLRKVIRFDPLPYWLAVDVPVLAFFGEKDEEDNVPVRESVRRLKRALALAQAPEPTILVIPGAGHALFREPGRFAPEFVDGLADWIEKTLAP